MAVLEVAISEKFDNTASQLRRIRKQREELELEIRKLPDSRQKAVALTKLDECWMWCFDTLDIVDIG